MKNKKAITTFLVLALSFLLLFAGCSSAPTQNKEDEKEEDADQSSQTQQGEGEASLPSTEWSIIVQANGQEIAITAAECALLTEHSVEMTITNKNGESTTSTYTGILLKDVLALAGAEPAQSVEAVAADGYSSEIPVEVAMADDTLISYLLDGVPYEGGQPIRLSPKTGSGNQFIKDLEKLVVN
ncbi:MAG: molybdopterin-dependent oxidoreductase [Eubacteriaceae bacterium]|nr:molybdopterin-dependent oxidoreductase [Eubacteriaceae bacterium]